MCRYWDLILSVAKLMVIDWAINILKNLKYFNKILKGWKC